MSVKFPDLPFKETDLEPYLSEETLHFHHKKHHRGYVDTLNGLIAGTSYETKTLEQIMLKSFQKREADENEKKIFNNAAQVWNHDFFWKCLRPRNDGSISAELENVLRHSFGSRHSFEKEFIEKGQSHFASGWLWLVKNRDGRLELITRHDADNPLCEGLLPIYTCDLWEHAYYLDYQNERAKFLESMLLLINWSFVEKSFLDNLVDHLGESAGPPLRI